LKKDEIAYDKDPNGMMNILCIHLYNSSSSSAIMYASGAADGVGNQDEEDGQKAEMREK
jgi:hypothetical protein